METKPQKAAIDCLDIRIAAAVGICYLSATLLNHCGLKFAYGEMHLEILQKMTACIACLLCCQDNTKISRKAGVNRLIITAISGVTFILVTTTLSGSARIWYGVFRFVSTFYGVLVVLIVTWLFEELVSQKMGHTQT